MVFSTKINNNSLQFKRMSYHSSTLRSYSSSGRMRGKSLTGTIQLNKGKENTRFNFL